jgi:Uma2 family endonuclease
MNFHNQISEPNKEETPVSAISDYELERGKPMPSKLHSRIELRLVKLLMPFEDKFDIMPELSLKLSTGEATPDICLFHKLSFDFDNDEIKVTDAPITTIEIISPTQAVNDVTNKIRQTYFPAGVKSAWVVQPSLQVINLLMPGKKTQAFTDGVMTDPATGVSIEINEVFK